MIAAGLKQIEILCYLFAKTLYKEDFIMERFELLRKIYNSLDDGKGILDLSLEGENRLVIWTEDGNKFVVSAEEESEE